LYKEFIAIRRKDVKRDDRRFSGPFASVSTDLLKH